MRPIEVHFEKNINNLTVVRETDTRRQVEYVAVSLLAALFVLGVLFYGWQRAQYLQYGYEIGKAENRQLQLVQKEKSLRIARAQLSNPTRIEGLARQMGMIDAMPGQQVSINLETIGDPQPNGNPQPNLSATK